MVQYVITPWRNHSELLRVRQHLYPVAGKPVDDSARCHAVAQVSVWMQRGNCPHLVESTAILTSAVLNDVPGNSAYCVRAAYSAAFCRFVTGLIDGFQNKGRKIGMYSIAKSIGLPATYVELRHQATHEELPSLPKLRTATQKALRWIWDYYWVNLSADYVNTDDCETYLRKLLEEKNEESHRRMEDWSSRWEEKELLAALEKIEESTEDTDVLLRSLRLAERIMSRGGKSEPDDSLTLELEVDNLNGIRAELARMQADLSDLDDEPQTSSAIKAPNLGGKGWSMWEGPWIPKPIGSIQ